MNSAYRMRSKKLGSTVVQNLQSRFFEAYYCDNAKAAKTKVLSMLKKDETIAFGGSVTLSETGILDELRKGEYKLIDRETAATPEDRKRMMKESLCCDTYLMSANAISEDGQIVNIDGVGNRLAAMMYGPDRVIMVVGINKIVRTVEDALSRARNTAAPINAQRFQISTPCMQTGVCGNCKRTDSICSHIVTTRLCRPAGRITVVIVGEELGF